MKLPDDNSLLIRLSGVTVSHERRDVLRDVDFSLRRGEFVAITGPNGGGKTTLMRVMLKLLTPEKGRVEYFRDSRPVKTLPIGYLPQKSQIDTRFPVTAGEAIAMGLLQGWWGHPSEADRDAMERVVDLCGVRDYLDRRIGVLSGGQLQRTLLARALVANPEVLMLDEPLSYVDKNFEKQIYSIMEELAREKTIVLVSHEMSVISAMATRHIIVDHGLHECTASHHYENSPCE